MASLYFNVSAPVLTRDENSDLGKRLAFEADPRHAI